MVIDDEAISKEENSVILRLLYRAPDTGMQRKQSAVVANSPSRFQGRFA